MSIIYTLLGVPYVAVLDPVRGVVLQKAARKRKLSPGQMSLFAGNEPKEGDTKVENGITYRLNQHSRWERTDKAKGTAKAKAKAVVPVVEEKAESKAKAKSKPSGIADMRQRGDTGSRRDEVKPMPKKEPESKKVTLSGNRRDPALAYFANPYEYGDVVSIGGQDWQVKQNTRGWYLTNTGDWRGAHPTIQNIDSMADLTALVRNEALNADDAMKREKREASTPEPNIWHMMMLAEEKRKEPTPEPTPAAADMVNEDLDTPEALPEPTIGDMLAEQKAEEEAGGMDVQGIAVMQGPNGSATNPESFKNDWARLKELELAGIAKRVGAGLTYKIPGFTFVNKERYETDPKTYKQTAVNWFAVIPDKAPVKESKGASVKPQQDSPKELRGDDGRKLISAADAASALAEAVNGRLWRKKEGEIRIYVSGTNNGYLKIMPESSDSSQVQYFMKSYDIPKVEEVVNAFNREYQVADIKDDKPKERVLMQESEDGVIAPAGQHDPGVYIAREWHE